MPKQKLKSHKGAQRRFKITGTGKILRMKVGRSHNRRKKAKRTKTLLHKMEPLHKGYWKQVRRLLPYGVD
jgi:large subunit ribosomal protein L35